MERIVLITGVAGGIGCAAAKVFAAEGWQVIGVDYKTSTDLDGVKLYLRANIAKPNEITNVLEQVITTFGRLDALVNNAAIQICKPILEMAVSEWDETMAINARATFLFSKLTHPFLKSSRGSIVNISSVHAMATSTNMAAYAASKGALTALTRALALEFAPEIRVNAILPGAVSTSMLNEHLTEEMMSNLVVKTPIGRISNPEEIAKAIFFLANKDASFITGQTLVVDGGALAKLGTE